jgi:hypothetical protein
VIYQVNFIFTTCPFESVYALLSKIDTTPVW